jgi:ribosomal protein S18 acetylase RimI-like enzyme
MQRRVRHLTIRWAGPDDRDTIYHIRHEIFARELGQYPVNNEELLTDARDAFNLYIAACAGDEIVGFVSITPPGHASYSVDTYLSRAELPFPIDSGLYEVRLLAVRSAYRRGSAAALLMLALLRTMEVRGATRIMVVGRRALRRMYAKVGLKSHGIAIRCGAVAFELMSATLEELQRAAVARSSLVRRLAARVDWQLEAPSVVPSHDNEVVLRGNE